MKKAEAEAESIEKTNEMVDESSDDNEPEENEEGGDNIDIKEDK